MPPNTRQRQCRIHETVAFTWQPVFPKNSWWPKDTKQLKFWCIMRHLEYKQVTQVTESEQTCIILIFQMSANCSHLQPLARSATCSHLQPLAPSATCSHLQPLGSHLAETLLQWLQQVAAKWLQVAASGWWGKWLQVADISKIKLRTSCAHNDNLSTSQTVWNRAGRHTVCLYFGSNSLWQKD